MSIIFFGRRIEKIDYSKSTINPESTIYVYNGDNIISEYLTYGVQVGGTGSLVPLTLKKNYLNSIGTDSVLAYEAEEQTNPTSTGKATNRYYYHTNQLGSVIAISTSTGLVVQKYSYNAHGKPYISVGNALYALSSYTGTLYGNSRLYTGREFENDTGYYYNRARYYSSDLGRFISRDPIGQNDQVNLYTYVANSPLKYVDRMGREKQLLEDIKNGNKFTVSLVGRNLEIPVIGSRGTHTFIMIDSKDSKGITRTYTIGGQSEDGKLTGKFNHPDDKIKWGGWMGYAAGSIKDAVQLDTPSGLTDGEFVQNIYDEYKDYNENHKVNFNLLSKSFLWDSGNCSNLATTLLYRASNNDENIQNQVSSFNTFMFDWGVGERLY